MTERPSFAKSIQSGVITPAMLAQDRVESAMTSSIEALTSMTKQLAIMNPIDKLVKLNHQLVSDTFSPLYLTINSLIHVSSTLQTSALYIRTLQSE